MTDQQKSYLEKLNVLTDHKVFLVCLDDDRNALLHAPFPGIDILVSPTGVILKTEPCRTRSQNGGGAAA